MYHYFQKLNIQAYQEKIHRIILGDIRLGRGGPNSLFQEMPKILCKWAIKLGALPKVQMKCYGTQFYSNCCL